jgi:hypothetical protein
MTTESVVILVALGMLCFAVGALVWGMVAVCKKHMELTEQREDRDHDRTNTMLNQCLAISEANLTYLRLGADNPLPPAPAPRYNGDPAPTIVAAEDTNNNPAFYN